MIASVKQAIALAGVLITSAALCWYHAGEAISYRLDPHTLATLPDHQITTLQVRQFDAQGKLIHHMTTPYMHHIPQHNQHWAKTPQVNSTSTSQANWEVRALEASAYQKQHTQHGIYRGQVALDHGNTHVRAYRATTESDAHNQLIRATVLGHGVQQAHVWVSPTAHKKPMHAFADRIRYEPQNKRLIFSGHARLEQGQDTIKAAEIFYDLKQQKIITPPHAKSRTEIIIHSSLQHVQHHE